MTLQDWPDDHISRFQLDRLAAGELTEAEQSALEARLEPAHRAYLDGLAQTKARLPAPDLAAIRARAATQTATTSDAPSQPASSAPAPANRPWMWGLLLAAAALNWWMLFVGYSLAFGISNGVGYGFCLQREIKRAFLQAHQKPVEK